MGTIARWKHRQLSTGWEQWASAMERRRTERQRRRRSLLGTGSCRLPAGYTRHVTLLRRWAASAERRRQALTDAGLATRHLLRVRLTRWRTGCELARHAADVAKRVLRQWLVRTLTLGAPSAHPRLHF